MMRTGDERRGDDKSMIASSCDIVWLSRDGSQLAATLCCGDPARRRYDAWNSSKGETLTWRERGSSRWLFRLGKNPTRHSFGSPVVQRPAKRSRPRTCARGQSPTTCVYVFPLSSKCQHIYIHTYTFWLDSIRSVCRLHVEVCSPRICARWRVSSYRLGLANARCWTPAEEHDEDEH